MRVLIFVTSIVREPRTAAMWSHNYCQWCKSSPASVRLSC